MQRGLCSASGWPHSAQQVLTAATSTRCAGSGDAGETTTSTRPSCADLEIEPDIDGLSQPRGDERQIVGLALDGDAPLVLVNARFGGGAAAGEWVEHDAAARSDESHQPPDQ